MATIYVVMHGSDYSGFGPASAHWTKVQAASAAGELNRAPGDASAYVEEVELGAPPLPVNYVQSVGRIIRPKTHIRGRHLPGGRIIWSFYHSKKGLSPFKVTGRLRHGEV